MDRHEIDFWWDNSLSFFSKLWKKKQQHDNKCVFQKHEHPRVMKYPVIICGLWVLITCDDLRRHPIWSTNEGIPSTDRLVKLCWDAKVNWNKKRKYETILRLKTTTFLFDVAGSFMYVCMTVWLFNSSARSRTDTLGKPPCMCRCVIPSLTSAFSVSKTFCPFMSLWITWWEWRWERPCKTHMKTHSQMTTITMNEHNTHTGVALCVYLFIFNLDKEKALIQTNSVIFNSNKIQNNFAQGGRLTQATNQ